MIDLVPTVRGTPVLLPSHKDVEFCFQGGEVEHFHVDWRYVHTDAPNLKDAIRAGEVLFQPMKKVRETHPIHPGLIFATWQMMCAFRWAELGPGRTCPHKGTLVPEEVCPAHGLRWDKDGRLKHRNSRLTFQLLGTKEVIKVGWEWRKVIEFPIVRSGYVVGVNFCADDEILVCHDMEPLYVVPGDIFKYIAECPDVHS